MGNPWCTTTLARALTAWRMAGLVEHEGVLYQAVWDAVYSLDTVEDLKALFAENRTAYGYHGNQRKHLLTNIAVCGHCHDPGQGDDIPAKCSTSVERCGYLHATLAQKPVGSRAGRRSRVYYCKLCGLGRNEEYLDAYVEGRALRLLSDPRFAAELRAEDGRERTGVSQEIATLERRKATLISQIDNAAEHAGLDPALAMRAIVSFDRKLAQLRAQLDKAAQERILERMVGITREQWDDEPIEVRAATVKALFQVAILPVRRGGRGFDPECVMVLRKVQVTE